MQFKNFQCSDTVVPAASTSGLNLGGFWIVPEPSFLDNSLSPEVGSLDLLPLQSDDISK